MKHETTVNLLRFPNCQNEERDGTLHRNIEQISSLAQEGTIYRIIFSLFLKQHLNTEDMISYIEWFVSGCGPWENASRLASIALCRLNIGIGTLGSYEVSSVSVVERVNGPVTFFSRGDLRNYETALCEQIKEICKENPELAKTWLPELKPFESVPSQRL